MKILVTGATGLIGRNLLKELQGEIYVLARNQSELNSLQQQYPHIKTLCGDVYNEDGNIVSQMDIIFHLAALRAVGKAEIDIEECINTNVIGTANLLKYFKGNKFITLSTDKAIQINSVYGASKFITERLILKYVKLNPHINYSIIRSGNVFNSKDSVISVWKNALINKQEIIVTDLEATRYFCKVEDVISTLLEVNKELISYPIMKSIAIKDLLEAMQIKYGKAISIKVIGRQLGENLHEKINEDDKGSQHGERYTVEQILNLI